VYAGVIYFSTYTPNADRCEMGTGRVYGIRFDDCSPGLDTDGVYDSINTFEKAVRARVPEVRWLFVEPDREA
jgi:hypothetical protein